MDKADDYKVIVENEGELSDYAVNQFARWALEIAREQGLLDDVKEAV